MADIIKFMAKDTITEGLKPDMKIPERVTLDAIHAVDGITWLRVGMIKLKKGQTMCHERD